MTVDLPNKVTALKLEVEKVSAIKDYEDLYSSVRPKQKHALIKPISQTALGATVTTFQTAPPDYTPQRNLSETAKTAMNFKQNSLKSSSSEKKFLLTKGVHSFRQNRACTVLGNHMSAGNSLVHNVESGKPSKGLYKNSISAVRYNNNQKEDVLHRDIFAQTRQVKVDDAFRNLVHGFLLKRKKLFHPLKEDGDTLAKASVYINNYKALKAQVEIEKARAKLL